VGWRHFVGDVEDLTFGELVMRSCVVAVLISGVCASALGDVIDVGGAGVFDHQEDGFKIEIDLSGVGSYAEMGSLLNDVFVHDFDAKAGSTQIRSLGWDLRVQTIGPSWLSEVNIGLGSSNGEGFFITPFVGTDFPGTATTSSGGPVDLLNEGLDFFLDAHNILNVEIFESFVDDPMGLDAIFLEGSSITIGYLAVIPTPGSIGVLFGGGMVFGTRRRR
jgi:hypothetical protein